MDEVQLYRDDELFRYSGLQSHFTVDSQSLRRRVPDWANGTFRRGALKDQRVEYLSHSPSARRTPQSSLDHPPFLQQIDSHMRFAPHWDTKLLAALAAAEARSPKAVLSSYPPPYEGLGAAASIPEDSRPTFLCAKEFGPDGLLHVTGRRAESGGGEPVRSAFWAAGFSFSRSAVIQEVRGGQYSYRGEGVLTTCKFLCFQNPHWFERLSALQPRRARRLLVACERLEVSGCETARPF